MKLHSRLDIFSMFSRPVSFQLWLHAGDEFYDEKNFRLTSPSISSLSSGTSRYITRPPTWNSELRVWQHNLGARVRRACQHNFVLTRFPQETDVYEGAASNKQWFHFPVSGSRVGRSMSQSSVLEQFQYFGPTSSHNLHKSVDSITIPNTPSTPQENGECLGDFPTIHSAQRVVIRHGKVCTLQVYRIYLHKISIINNQTLSDGKRQLYIGFS